MKRVKLSRRRLRPVIFVVVFACIGIAAYAVTRAAPSSVAIEAENGTRSGNAQPADAGEASNGRYVIFQAASSATGPRKNVPGLPAQGTLLGMHSEQAPQRASGIPKLEDGAHMGRKFDLRMRFYDYNAVLNADLSDDFNNGRTPIVSWEPATWGAGLSENNIGRMSRGELDGYIRQVANKLKNNKPVHLRFAHEMNGFWYGWSKASPAEYRTAWQRAFNIFQEQGATNVVWVWTPFAINFPQNGNPYTAYYPGDQYVHIVGLDMYVHKPEQSIGDVLGNGPGSVYGDYHARKPIFIMETMSGPRVDTQPFYQNKSVFFRDMVGDLKTKFPDISGVVFFDEYKLPPYYQDGDFSIEKSGNAAADQATMAAFVAMSKDCHWGSDARQAACRGQ